MHNVRKGILLSSIVVAAAGIASAGGGKAQAQGAFEKLKSLAGTWQGTGSEGDQSMPAEVRYRVTGGGSAVVETMFPDTPHEMVSVYHMDGDALVMTHYCAAGNQPKFKLGHSTSASELKFDFAGGTNVDAKKGFHIHSGAIRPVEKDVLEEEWTAWSDGKPASVKKLRLTRKAVDDTASGTR